MSNLDFHCFNEHLLRDIKPSLYFKSLIQKNIFPVTSPYKWLLRLREIEQNPKYHPEGNVWEHTMQVVDHAATYKHLSNDTQTFMWTSLLHDIGKGTTTKIRNGKITSYDHDIEGAKLARKFLSELHADKELIEKTGKLVRWHMQPLFVNKKLPFAKLKEMLTEIPCTEIALFSLCDRLGRSVIEKEAKEKELEDVISFLKVCQSQVDSADLKSEILKMLYELSALEFVEEDYVQI